jgi:class 3 adenylate cyclase
MQFDDFALEIDDITHHNARRIVGIVEGVAVTITSLSLFNKTVWPYFTLPHYEIRIEDLLDTSGADFAAFSPVITDDTKALWETYALENQGWIQDGLKLTSRDLEENKITSIPTAIYPDKGVGDHYLPVWQTYPAPKDPSIVNFDLLSDPAFRRIFNYVIENREPALSEVVNVTNLFGDAAPDLHGHPQSLFVQPVYDSLGGNSVVVAILTSVIPWELYFTDLLHQGADGIVCVLRDTCGDVFTYGINGPEAIYVGKGDQHDPEYDHLLHVTEFRPHLKEQDNNVAFADANCEYSFFIYPSDQLREEYTSNRPALLAMAVVAVFIFTSIVFLLYDYFVQQRQAKVMHSAQRSDAIVSSLFPAEIRDRIFRNGDSQKAKKSSRKKQGKKGGFLPGLNNTPTFGLKNFLNENDPDNETSEGNINEDNIPGDVLANEVFESKPIADLFPHTTVMFADIAGFTAWSSVREPCQVFTLLETVYRGFDNIAKRRRVFKVETIGDCYVAVCGLPEPRKDHAVVMARFARNCMERMNELTQKLEVTLGPDTGELTIRVGLHSGPVTAGVLRGEKSRFQLFGDTVNTAARLESTGERDRIHISEETASLLEAAGKPHWFKARAEKVVAKGKGELQTFWLHIKNAPGSSDGIHASEKKEEGRDTLASKADATAEEAQGLSLIKEKRLMEAHTSAKIQRLVGWNVDVLLRLLKQIVAARHDAVQHDDAVRRLERQMGKGSTVLEEVAEFVTLPEFDNSKLAMRMDPNKVVISPIVVTQLHEYVTLIASMYLANAFHSFEHASHVTMSVSKLLSRIVARDMSGETGDDSAGTHHAHDGTYGITSDPLTQFSVVLAALIHDVDHRGVPNFLLIQENYRLAAMYNNKSVAEQNSVDLAWDKLMDDKFDHLRCCIYANTEELVRFRQLVVNTVMATDIFDKELSVLRRSRWDKVFSKTSDRCPDEVNRKATIVIEHLIQASDVAHTMQHWQIFCKWNERLFKEMYDAYNNGRSDKDPSLGWYQGELGFFDNYIIPLARKLKDCGVFGVSSDEYLNYALENRREWSARGEDVVKKMIQKICTDDAKPSHD